MAKTTTTTAPEAGDADAFETQDSAPTLGETTSPKLTTDWSEEFGPQGRILDLTEAQIAAAPKGLLIDPTADQLALRRL